MTALSRRHLGAMLIGSTAALAAPRIAQGAPSDVGQWSTVYPLENIAVHLHLLRDQRLLAYEDTEYKQNSTAYVFQVSPGSDPSNFLYRPNNENNLFCAGHTFLPDGRLLVVGGQDGAYYEGLADAAIFQYANNYEWVRPANAVMNAPRWYPTAITLANGEILVLGGQSTRGSHNKLPQIWKTNAGGGWRDLSTAILQVALYSWAFQAPNGRVFVAGKHQPYWLTTSGTGTWTRGPARKYTGPRDRASAAMYRPGKILLCGGGNSPSTNTAEVIDLTAASPQWRLIDPMRHARNFHNATILADGTVLVTGGGAGPNDASVAVQETELWDPDTERWTPMAPLSGHRLYHSTAILLPDGRVLCAGGGRPPSKNAADRKEAQIFSPPYLFEAGAARPTITSAPTGRIAYGATFTVDTPDAASIGAVNLVKHGSVTHSFDMGQQFYAVPPSDIVPAPGGLQLKAPPNGRVATPGHYLLFLLKDGVPSVARSIRIG